MDRVARQGATMMKMTLDTDIGSDVDDSLALAMILGSPHLGLQIVTTVYGDTAFQARIVHRAYALAGRSPPPIAAGARETRSGKPVWWAGHEGALMADLGLRAVRWLARRHSPVAHLRSHCRGWATHERGRRARRSEQPRRSEQH